MEYDYPALDVEGASVTFACPPGLMLSGPNTSTCIGNGEWEPDPRDVECKSKLILVIHPAHESYYHNNSVIL